MKILLTLFLGILIGIGGEFLIPKSYYVTVGSGCIRDGNMIFMPELRIYNEKMDKYPLPYGGLPMEFVPSYRYAYALATKEISYLPQNECNVLVEKILDNEP